MNDFEVMMLEILEQDGGRLEVRLLWSEDYYLWTWDIQQMLRETYRWN